MIDPTVLIVLVAALAVIVAMQAAYSVRLKRTHAEEIRKIAVSTAKAVLDVVADSTETGLRPLTADNLDDVLFGGSPFRRKTTGPLSGAFVWPPGDPIPADAPTELKELLRSIESRSRGPRFPLDPTEAHRFHKDAGGTHTPPYRPLPDSHTGGGMALKNSGSADPLADPVKDTTTINEAAHGFEDRVGSNESFASERRVPRYPAA